MSSTTQNARDAGIGGRIAVFGQLSLTRSGMLLLVYYVIAITILVLHFTGWLRYHNLEWLVLVLAATVFPAVLYL